LEHGLIFFVSEINFHAFENISDKDAIAFVGIEVHLPNHFFFCLYGLLRRVRGRRGGKGGGSRLTGSQEQGREALGRKERRKERARRIKEKGAREQGGN
jgi:hypothetical protein